MFNIYRLSENDGYPNTTKRFELIEKIQFENVFDFGSGPCSLLKWLNEKNIKCVYEAYDLRKDSLEQHCDCKKHFEVPKQKYDLVCLLGVSGLNIEKDTEKTKQQFVKILNQCVDLTKKHLLVNFSYQKQAPKYYTSYEIEEIKKLLDSANLNILHYEKDEHMKENIFMCELKNKG